MAYFEIGGSGDPRDTIRVSQNNTQQPNIKGKPGKKPKLTPEEQRKLSEALRKFKPQNNTKYGVNTPTKPPKLPPGFNTKYGVNTPAKPPQLPPGFNTKYGINTPKK